MFTPEGEASPIKPLSLAEYDFDKAVGFFDDAKALREKELLQQFENGKVREEYRQLLKDGKMTYEELQAVLDGKKNEVVQEVVTGDYKDKKYALQGMDKLDNEENSEYNEGTIENAEENDGQKLPNEVRESEKLGREYNFDTPDRRSEMGEMGSAQSQKQNTPNTRKIHRSGVSAKGITDSGLTVEQYNLRKQNKQEGFDTEFFTEAVFNGENQQKIFNTDNTIYYPANDFEESSYDEDYIRYNATALLKESTIDTYLRDYAAKSSSNYAQAYIAYMTPSDFLELTTSGVASRLAIERESIKLQENKFAEVTLYQPIQLIINHKTGKVESHEGRHRMVALMNEGIYDVPVLLFDSSNKYDKDILNNLELKGQFNKYHTAIVGEAIPLSYANRDLVIEKFGTMSEKQRRGEKYGTSKTLRYSLPGNNKLDSEYLELAKNPKKNEAKLRRIADEAAIVIGLNIDKPLFEDKVITNKIVYIPMYAILFFHLYSKIPNFH